MVNPASPTEAGNAKLGYAISDDGAGNPQATLPRMVRPGIVDAESTPSGALAVDGLEEPLSAVIDEADDDPATIVAAPGAGLCIRVWQYTFVVEGDVDVTWLSDPTPLTGTMHFTADGEGIVSVGGGLVPLMTCAEDEALVLQLSAEVQVSGHVSYTVVAV